ncbi:hypothetical protein IJJ12_02725 [bacterium]|nr:hypothetical protein [bacterium]
MKHKFSSALLSLGLTLALTARCASPARAEIYPGYLTVCDESVDGTEDYSAHHVMVRRCNNDYATYMRVEKLYAQWLEQLDACRRGVSSEPYCYMTEYAYLAPGATGTSSADTHDFYRGMVYQCGNGWGRFMYHGECAWQECPPDYKAYNPAEAPSYTGWEPVGTYWAQYPRLDGTVDHSEGRDGSYYSIIESRGYAGTACTTTTDSCCGKDCTTCTVRNCSARYNDVQTIAQGYRGLTFGGESKGDQRAQCDHIRCDLWDLFSDCAGARDNINARNKYYAKVQPKPAVCPPRHHAVYVAVYNNRGDMYVCVPTDGYDRHGNPLPNVDIHGNSIGYSGLAACQHDCDYTCADAEGFMASCPAGTHISATGIWTAPVGDGCSKTLNCIRACQPDNIPDPHGCHTTCSVTGDDGHGNVSTECHLDCQAKVTCNSPDCSGTGATRGEYQIPYYPAWQDTSHNYYYTCWVDNGCSYQTYNSCKSETSCNCDKDGKNCQTCCVPGYDTHYYGCYVANACHIYVSSGKWPYGYCIFGGCAKCGRPDSCQTDQVPGKFGGYCKHCGNNGCSAEHGGEEYYYVKSCRIPSCPKEGSIQTVLQEDKYTDYCGKHSSVVGPGNTGLRKIGGVFQCTSEYKPDVEQMNSQDKACGSATGCTDAGMTCWAPKPCSGTYPDEYTTGTGIFIPDKSLTYPGIGQTGTAGKLGYRCGKYYPLGKPIWHTDGDIYAEGGTKDSSTGNDSSQQHNISGAQTCHNMKHYADTDYLTADNAFSNDDIELNYAYFTNLVNYDHLQLCDSDTLQADEKGIVTCRLLNNDTTKNIETNYLSGHNKYVVFIEGDLEVNQAVYAETNNIKAFIVSGDITFAHSERHTVDTVGRPFPDAEYCPRPEHAKIQGLYIARKFYFAHQPVVFDNDFNAGLRCDSQIIIYGSLIQYKANDADCVGADGPCSPEELADRHNFKIDNTFVGCNLDRTQDIDLATYHDPNLDKPTFAIFYRADLADTANLPSWLAGSSTQRYETN